ncbi:hypothetical protein KPL70_010541 [Citrus sinensis]|nr:hypothetical protein KPL70_010541 [Citrus sinensis]
MHIDFPMTQFCTSSSKLPSPSSSSSSNLNFPVSANNNSALRQTCTSCSCSCHSDPRQKLESVDRSEEKRASGLSDNTVFGPVPSNIEVENAVAALQSFMDRISSFGTELKWLLGRCDPAISLSQGQGYGRGVYDAFRMLQSDPSVKRLVVSLSSDRAVWEAVINNELVRKLRESLYAADNALKHNSDEEPNMAADILKWILDTTKAKVTELIEKFQALMDQIFKPFDSDQNPTEETRGDLEDKVRSSFLLSIVILVIVVVARAHS